MVGRQLTDVAAGHAAKGGSAICVPDQPEGKTGKPDAILKVLDPTEFEVYTRLNDSFADDPVAEFIPRFDGECEDIDENGNLTKFIRIQNLLRDFQKPKVMDVKLGNRTFLESESDNPKLRPDLFERVDKLYPSELTSEEYETRAITKHRFMTLRDANSTIGNLSYRIDGMAGYRRRSRAEIAEAITTYRTLDDTHEAFLDFVATSATDDGEHVDEPDCLLVIARTLQEKLQRFSDALETSDFIAGQEFIGSSALLIADASGNAGVFWIDFAKTHPAPEGINITHRDWWEKGNHEDGIIMGVKNLRDSWSQVVGSLSMPDAAASFTSSKFVQYPSAEKPQRAMSWLCRCFKPQPAIPREKSRESIAEWDTDVNILNALSSFVSEGGGLVLAAQGVWGAKSVAVKVAGGAMGAAGVVTGAVAFGARESFKAVRRRSVSSTDCSTPSASRVSGLQTGSTTPSLDESEPDAEV